MTPKPRAASWSAPAPWRFVQPHALPCDDQPSISFTIPLPDGPRPASSSQHSTVAAHSIFRQYAPSMSSSRRSYPFHLIEPKWQQIWDAQQAFRAFNPDDLVPDGHPFGLRHQVSGKVTTAQL